MTRKEELISVIQFATLKLKNSPDGILITRKTRYGTRYYQRITGSKPGEIYLGKKNAEIIKALQEKAYFSEMKKVAEKELEALTEINRIKEKLIDYEKVFNTIPDSKKTLIKPYDSPETENVKKKIEKECKYWEKDKVDRRGVDKNLKFVSLNGERVRSKSELIIADRLKNAGIPYYYEGKYLLVDEDTMEYQAWFPDFQLFNIRTGEKFFWEHFGIMDNPEYCASCQFKLETYAKYGIVMGKNLIVTMESSKHSLNTEYVDLLIKEFLK